jgi:dienelactone hydrolase
VTERVTFTSGGVTCVGYFRGLGGGAPRPCVVLCSGFGGTQDTPSILANAQTFAATGYAAMTFDYANFGESSGQPRQLVDINGQLNDIHAAVECARGHSGVDADRIVLWGTSLGGGHVVTAAARDPRIAAVIAQVPFNGFPKRVEGRSVATTLRLLWAMTIDRIRGALRLPPAYIPAVSGPGELAVMASTEALHAIEA